MLVQEKCASLRKARKAQVPSMRGRKTTDGATHSRSTFTIHVNDVALYAPSKRSESLPAGAIRFRSEREFSRLAASWPASRLVAIWNRLPASKPVCRFTDRKTAIRRIWRAIQSLSPASRRQPAQGREKSHRPGSGAIQKASVRQRTKTDRIIDLLRQPSGATLQDIMAASDWQAHSVRGFISGQLRNRMGLRVKSIERNGGRVYAIQD